MADIRAQTTTEHIQLITASGAVLGAIVLPEWMLSSLKHRGRVSFNSPAVRACVGTLTIAHSSNFARCVQLHGALLEELEVVHGVTFCPQEI